MFRVVIEWLIHLLGGYTRAQYDNQYNNLTEHHEKTVGDLEARYDRAMVRVHELTERLENIEMQTREETMTENKRLKTENDKLTADLVEAEEYYKSVQKTISEALHENQVYAFPRNFAIPGSTSIDTRTIKDPEENQDYLVIAGRTVFTDDVTQAIQNQPSIWDKYNLALNQLIKYGVMDKIARDLISNGTMEVVLAYNDNCTSIEMYYNLKLLKPKVSYSEKKNGTGD